MAYVIVCIYVIICMICTYVATTKIWESNRKAKTLALVKIQLDAEIDKFNNHIKSRQVLQQNILSPQRRKLQDLNRQLGLLKSRSDAALIPIPRNKILPFRRKETK